MKLEGFIGPSYTLEAPSAGSQRLVNLYVEGYEGGQLRKGNPARIKGTPGLRQRATLGDGPLRGIHWTATKQCFVVSGANVYEVFSGWVAQLRSGGLASSSGRVSMADDGTRLVIGDGGTTAFSVNLAAGSPVTPIPAPCPGGHVTWQDGYFLHTVPNSGRFMFSGLNALTYDVLDVATAEGRPDNLATVLSVQRMVWLFGDETIEVWWNDGVSPFARNEAGFIETGTLSAATCVRVAGSVAWVVNDERGRGTVMHAQGFQPVRISTHAVEQALASYANLDEASAFAYQQEGHEFYQLSVPGSDTDAGGTWVYDFTTGLWHERSYQSATGEEPHRAWVGAVAFGEVVVGDREDGRLYSYDLAYCSDDGDPIRRMRQAPHISQDEKEIVHRSFQLQAQMGVGLDSGQGSSPTVILQWSDDAGSTWSNEHEASLGLRGDYKNRAIWRRLGKSRDRVYRVIITDPVQVILLGAEINPVELGA